MSWTDAFAPEQKKNKSKSTKDNDPAIEKRPKRLTNDSNHWKQGKDWFTWKKRPGKPKDFDADNAGRWAKIERNYRRAIFKNEVRSFLFTQTQPTKPQKTQRIKPPPPPKDTTTNQTDMDNDESKGLPNLETVEAKHSSDAEQQSQEETTEAPNSETPL